MRKLDALLAWFFTSLGFALVGFAILIVPADAFAAYNGECVNCQNSSTPSQCASDCCSTFKDDLTARCQCCNDACGGDLDCLDRCVKEACGSDLECQVTCMNTQGGKCPEKAPSLACNDKCFLKIKMVDGKVVFDCTDGGTGVGTCKSDPKACSSCKCRVGVITKNKQIISIGCYCVN